MSKLKNKAIKAAARFLESRGCEILERSWSSEDGSAVDLVARDGEALVFCDVYARRGTEKGMPDGGGEGSREHREVNAAKWLAEHTGDYVGCPVRFDVISMLAVSEGRAFLRHSVNCLGGDVVAGSTD